MVWVMTDAVEYMPNPPPLREMSPADAVAFVAARHGFRMPGHVTRAIADAVLECTDGDCFAQAPLHPELPPEAEAALRKRLHHQIVTEILSKGMLPTALLPRETREFPVHQGSGPMMRLSVPCRWAARD
jgi:hypothetical protein